MSSSSSSSFFQSPSESRRTSPRSQSVVAEENLKIMRFVDHLSEEEQDAFEEWLDDAEYSDAPSHLRQHYGVVLSPPLSSSSSASLPAIDMKHPDRSEAASLPSISSNVQDPLPNEPQAVADAFFEVGRVHVNSVHSLESFSILCAFVDAG
jgi:hypothetical protein